jgi:hypothetical protein
LLATVLVHCCYRKASILGSMRSELRVKGYQRDVEASRLANEDILDKAHDVENPATPGSTARTPSMVCLWLESGVCFSYQ